MIVTQKLLDDWSVLEHRDSPGYKDYLGGFYFRDRMEFIADKCCRLFPGNLIEVGVYSGQTSVKLAAMAKHHGRKLICVDSWVPGDPDYKYEEVEKAFYKTIKGYEDIVEVWKIDAHCKEAMDRIISGQWCFALSDDGHRYEHHMVELGVLLPSTTGVVVADDVYYEPDVKNAMRDSVKKNPGWITMFGDRLREGYMIRNS